MSERPLYAFDISLHPLSHGAVAGPPYEDDCGVWVTLVAPREAVHEPFAVPYDEALERFAAIDRMVVEPDGALLCAAGVAERAWQIDGTAWDLGGRLLRVDICGTCPAAMFDRLLGACGWPDQQVLVQLVRPAVFLAEVTFRSHATARWTRATGATLRVRGPFP